MGAVDGQGDALRLGDLAGILVLVAGPLVLCGVPAGGRAGAVIAGAAMRAGCAGLGGSQGWVCGLQTSVVWAATARVGHGLGDGSVAADSARVFLSREAIGTFCGLRECGQCGHAVVSFSDGIGCVCHAR